MAKTTSIPAPSGGESSDRDAHNTHLSSADLADQENKSTRSKPQASPARRLLERSNIITRSRFSRPASRKSDTSTSEESNVTPRSLIQTMLLVQDTAKPEFRQKQQAPKSSKPPSHLSSVRRSSRRHSSLIGSELENTIEMFTPRTNVVGFLQQASEEAAITRAELVSFSSTNTTGSEASMNASVLNEVEVTMLEESPDSAFSEKASKQARISNKRNLNIPLPHQQLNKNLVTEGSQGNCVSTTFIEQPLHVSTSNEQSLVVELITDSSSIPSIQHNLQTPKSTDSSSEIPHQEEESETPVVTSAASQTVIGDETENISDAPSMAKKGYATDRNIFEVFENIHTSVENTREGDQVFCNRTECAEEQTVTTVRGPVEGIANTAPQTSHKDNESSQTFSSHNQETLKQSTSNKEDNNSSHLVVEIQQSPRRSSARIRTSSCKFTYESGSESKLTKNSRVDIVSKSLSSRRSSRFLTSSHVEQSVEPLQDSSKNIIEDSSKGLQAVNDLSFQNDNQKGTVQNFLAESDSTIGITDVNQTAVSVSKSPRTTHSFNEIQLLLGVKPSSVGESAGEINSPLRKSLSQGHLNRKKSLRFAASQQQPVSSLSSPFTKKGNTSVRSNLSHPSNSHGIPSSPESMPSPLSSTNFVTPLRSKRNTPITSTPKPGKGQRMLFTKNSRSLMQPVLMSESVDGLSAHLEVIDKPVSKKDNVKDINSKLPTENTTKSPVTVTEEDGTNDRPLSCYRGTEESAPDLPKSLDTGMKRNDATDIPLSLDRDTQENSTNEAVESHSSNTVSDGANLQVLVHDDASLLDEGDNTSEDIEEDYTPLRTPLLPKEVSFPVTASSSDCFPVNKNPAPLGIKRKSTAPSRTAKRSCQGLPTSVVKAAFTHFSRLRVSKEAIDEVKKISEAYWKQMAEDLEAYALHAHRKTIDESDVELLMRRQGFITDSCSLNTLIAMYLPLEHREKLIPMARSGNRLEPKP